MVELITDTRVEAGKPYGPCTGQAVAAITQEANKAKNLANEKRTQAHASLATKAGRKVLKNRRRQGRKRLAVSTYRK